MTKNSERKIISRIKICSALLRLTPFLRFVGLNGSVARGENHSASDIDFLIVAKAGRLYTTRFFATVLVNLSGWRRHGEKVADRICLNCYLSCDNLNIKPARESSLGKVALSNYFLISLLDSGDVYEKFMAQNAWMSEFVKKIPKARIEALKDYQQDFSKKVIKSRINRPFGLFEPILSGVLGDFLEKNLMAYQVRQIKRGKKVGDETLSTKDQIKLHPKKTKGGP